MIRLSKKYIFKGIEINLKDKMQQNSTQCIIFWNVANERQNIGGILNND